MAGQVQQQNNRYHSECRHVVGPRALPQAAEDPGCLAQLRGQILPRCIAPGFVDHTKAHTSIR